MAGERGNQSKNNLNRIKSQWSTAIVDHVVLNVDDTRITEFSKVKEGVDPKDTSLIGCIFIRETTDLSSNNKEFPIARPFNDSIGVPLKGETVRVLKDGINRYYDRIHSNNVNKGNAIEDADLALYGKSAKTNTNKTKDYSESSQTGISKKSSDGGEADRKQLLGEYFEPTQINKLKLYEGDRLIESRFGQSLRFSGYNNPDNIFSPTIILRNRQNDESLSNLDMGSITEEDINKDGSVIVLSSKDYKSEFTSPTEIKATDGFNKDDGYDQIIINSERIILSSKTQEMLFFSKGDFRIISDSRLTIDNGLGAELDFGDDVNIKTDRVKGKNFTVLTGQGNIFLNTVEKNERIVRGDTLVDLLSELIDAINNQVYNTPAGPSAVGPTNRKDFSDIKSRLVDALSTLNYTE